MDLTSRYKVCGWALGRGARGARGARVGREEPSLRRVARGAPAVELDARVGRHAGAGRAAAVGRRARRLTHAQLLQHLHTSAL